MHTLDELKKAGYHTFEKLILMPTKLAFDQTTSNSFKTAICKLDERKKIAENYKIVGNVGDRFDEICVWISHNR